MAALKTSAVAHSPSAASFLKRILRDPTSKQTCVIIDLATISDGEHLISFVQSSPSIRHLPLVAIGRTEDFEALPDGLEATLNGVVTAPYTAGELAAVIATICEQRGPPISPEH